MGSRHNSPSLLDLPLDIIYEIIFYATEGQVKLISNELTCEAADVSVFVVNKYLPHFKDILALSTTCVLFRKLLGTCLFTHVSFVRKDQTDAILSTPSPPNPSLKSKEKEYRRQLIREVLERGFQECSNSEQAKRSYKVDSSFKSRYESFSMNNFVKYVEGGKELINEDMKYFPNTETFKILDSAFGDNDNDQTLKLRSSMSNLDFLSLNLINIDVVKHLIPKVKRLDLFIDFNELERYHVNELSKIFKGQCEIKELSLFVSEDYCVCHEPFIRLIDDVCGQKLEKLSIREVRRSIRISHYHRSENYWGSEIPEVYYYCGDWFVASIDRCSTLKLLTMDVDIFRYFEFSGETAVGEIPRKDLTLVLVHPTLVVPDFQLPLKHFICFVIELLGILNVSLQYGDPLSQSDLTALRLITQLVAYLKHYRVTLNNVSIEQCWSTREEMVLRDYIRDAITQGDKAKIQLFQPWGILNLNSPKFRRPTSAQVIYQGDDVKFRFDHSSYNDVSKSFWMAETSLLELEQYTRGPNPKPLSR